MKTNPNKRNSETPLSIKWFAEEAGVPQSTLRNLVRMLERMQNGV